MARLASVLFNKRLYVTVFIILMLGGCSSIPKPVAQIASAQTAIEAAIKIEAPKFAAVELDRAQNNLARAHDEMKKGDNAEARRLAEQAKAEAEYANAKTVATRINASTRQMEDSVRILQDQINR